MNTTAEHPTSEPRALEEPPSSVGANPQRTVRTAPQYRNATARGILS